MIIEFFNAVRFKDLNSCSAYPPLVLAPSLPDLTSHGLCDVESHLQSEEPVTVVYLCPGKGIKARRFDFSTG